MKSTLVSPQLKLIKITKINFCITLITVSSLAQLFILVKPAYAKCKEGVFRNFFTGEFKCAKDQAVGEIKKAGPYIVSPNYWSTYTAINTLKETGVIKNGGQCYAAVQAAKTGGAIAARAYGIPPQVAGLVATIAGAEANQACDSSFGKPSSQEVDAAVNTPGTSGKIDPTIAQAQFDAGVKIATLQANAKIQEAQIISDALQRQTQAQEQGKTERVKIESETLLALTKANNEVELRQIDLNAAIKRRELTNNLIGQGLDTILKYFLSKVDLEKEREITKREIELKKIDLEIAKTNSVQRPNSQVDNNLALVQSWGLTITSCSSAVTAISIDGKQYCTIPNNGLRAKQYVYNRTTNQLMAANIQTSSQMNGDPGLALLQSWGLTIKPSCNPPVAIIFIDNKQYCTIPNNRLRAKQYVYDRARNRLKAIRNVNYAPNPSPHSSSGFR